MTEERSTIEEKVEEYLTPEELSRRIKISVGTIRNWVSQGKFKPGFHYVKAGSRLRFIWSRIEKDWLCGGSGETLCLDNENRSRIKVPTFSRISSFRSEGRELYKGGLNKNGRRSWVNDTKQQ